MFFSVLFYQRICSIFICNTFFNHERILYVFKMNAYLNVTLLNAEYCVFSKMVLKTNLVGNIRSMVTLKIVKTKKIVICHVRHL